MSQVSDLERMLREELETIAANRFVRYIHDFDEAEFDRELLSLEGDEKTVSARAATVRKVAIIYGLPNRLAVAMNLAALARSPTPSIKALYERVLIEREKDANQ